MNHFSSLFDYHRDCYRVSSLQVLERLDALIRSGRRQDAIELYQWIESDLTPDEIGQFWLRYLSFLKAEGIPTDWILSHLMTEQTGKHLINLMADLTSEPRMATYLIHWHRYEQVMGHLL